MEEMIYITKSKTSEGLLPAGSGEKMEPVPDSGLLLLFRREAAVHFTEKSAYINGDCIMTIPVCPLIREVSSYMADYIADDQGRILAVHYDCILPAAETGETHSNIVEAFSGYADPPARP